MTSTRFASLLLLLALSAVACGKSDSKATGTPASTAQQGLVPGPRPVPTPVGPSAPVSRTCAEINSLDLSGTYVGIAKRRMYPGDIPHEIILLRDSKADGRYGPMYRLSKPGFIPRRPGYTVLRFEPFQFSKRTPVYCAARWYNPKTRDSEFNLLLGMRRDGSMIFGGDNPLGETDSRPLFELRRAP